MSLNNVTTENNILKAIGPNASSVSKPRTSSSTFTTIKDVHCKFEFSNISESVSPDLLISNSPLLDGHDLLLIKDDNSYVGLNVVGSNVTVDTLVGLDINTKGNRVVIDPTLTIITNDQGDTGYKDGNIYGSIIDSPGKYYWETTSTAVDVTIGVSTVNTVQDDSFATKDTGYGYIVSNYGFKVSNSVYEEFGPTDDLSNETTGLLYDYDTGELSLSVAGVDYGVMYTLPPNTPVYPAYATSSTMQGNLGYITAPDDMEYLPNKDVKFLEQYMYIYDLSEYTNGEIPSKVFIVNDDVRFNNKPSTILSDNYTNLIPDVLSTTRTFKDTKIDSELVITTVTLSAIGNKCTEIKGDLYKLSQG